MIKVYMYARRQFCMVRFSPTYTFYELQSLEVIHGFCISIMGRISPQISDGPNGAFTKQRNGILHAGVNSLLFRDGFRNAQTMA